MITPTYVLISIWEGDAIEPEPIATFATAEEANGACRQYVLDSGSSYDPDVVLEDLTDGSELAHYECTVSNGYKMFSARVCELPQPQPKPE